MSFAKTSIVIGGSTKELEAAVDRAMGKLSSMASSVVGIFAGIATVKWGYELLKQSEASEIAFTKLLGSADVAKQTLKEIADFASKTPMDNPTLVKAYQTLLAFKFGAEDIPGILRTIGDAASAMPGNMSENVQRLSVIMGQMRSKTKASAQEILQLTEAGINANEYIRQALKLDTVGEVSSQMEKGLIDSATAVRAVLMGMERDFAGTMEQRSKTVEGLLSTISDNTGKALLAVFKGATGGEFKTWLDDIGNGLDGLATIGEDVGNRIAGGLQVVKNVFDGIHAVASAIGEVIRAAFDAIGIKDFSGELSNVRTNFDLVKNIAHSFIQGFGIGLAFIGDAINNYVVGPLKVIGGLMAQFVSRILEATATLLDGLGYVSDTAKQMAKDLHATASTVNAFGEKLSGSGARDINSGFDATAATKGFFKKVEANSGRMSMGEFKSGLLKSWESTLGITSNKLLDFGKKVSAMTSLLPDTTAAMRAELKARQAKIDEDRKKQAEDIAAKMKSPLEQFQDAMLAVQQNPNLSKGEKGFAIAEQFRNLASTLPQYQPNNALLAGSAEAQSTINAARFGSTKVEDVIRQAKDEAVATRRGVEEMVRLLERAKIIPAEI